MLTRSLLFLILLAPASLAQDLLYSFANTLQGSPAPYERMEIHRLDPAQGTRPFLPKEAWNVLMGDRDGNGQLDDAPTDVDAFHVASFGGVTLWHFSTTTSVNIPGVANLRDGDVWTFDGSGGVVLLLSEADFQLATGTSGIDVDAYTVGGAGEIYFSFGEDETTTDSSLIAANGGVAVLDETTVFRLDPGASTAVIQFTKDQVVGLFNQALGTSASTVVDITGLAQDPQGGPGDLLMCCGSTSSSLRARVISSRGGGIHYTVAGQPIEPSIFQVGTSPYLNALATVQAQTHHVLRAHPAAGSVSAGGPGEVRLEGLAPGQVIQLVASAPRTPGPFAWSAPWASGFSLLYPDFAAPGFAQTLLTPEWSLVANSFGVASYRFDFAAARPGTVGVIQGVDLASGEVTSPLAMNFLQ